MKNLFKSLANFQQEVPVLLKATQGYGYTYTELSDIMKTINPLLKKHGLGFTQEIEGTSIKTTIFHAESGEFRESSADIPQGVELKGMNQFQVMGSAITYIRRYALSSALGLVTDKDTDAGGEQKKTEAKPLNIPVLKGKIIACKDLKELSAIYNSDVRIKTNTELVELIKERRIDIESV